MSTITLNSSIQSVQTTSKAPSLASLPLLFVTTLFEPFLFSPSDYQKAIQRSVQQIKQDGVLGIMRRIGRALRENPLDAFILAGSLALGRANIQESSNLIPMTVAIAGAIRNSQTIIKFVNSMDAKTILEKSVKIILCGSTIYLAASIPVAAALEWNSVAAAKRHYGGGPCVVEWGIKSAADCFHEGKNLNECEKLIPADVERDLQIFTLHPSKAVSIVQLDQKRVCFLTALNSDSPVTKTCFADIADTSNRTVEVIKDMTLADAHEGLMEGMSIRHLGVHKDGRSCGGFNEQPADMNLGEKPVCLLTALRPGGEVTQTCYNPNNPTAVTLKQIEDVELDFKEDGKPVSIVIKNPKMLGLDPYPEQESSEASCTYVCKKNDQ